MFDLVYSIWKYMPDEQMPHVYYQVVLFYFI